MSSRAPRRGAALVRGLWSRVRVFLEIIGLREERGADYETRLSQLKLRYFQFRDLLSANNELLEVIAEMEVRLRSPSPIPLRAVRAHVLTALTCTHRMVRGLNAISRDRYPTLETVYNRIQNRLALSLAPPPGDEAPDPVLPLARLGSAQAPLVGAKMASLGEIRNRLGLPVPDGFAVTVAGFEQVREAARAAAPAPADQDPQAVAADTRARLLASQVPADLAAAIRRACRALAGGGEPPPVSVRSSALDEDTEVSFAGQYLTLLGVRIDDVVDAYREVVASAYDREAVFYRQALGFDDDDLAVAVGCMVMVDALASGVAFSSDPLGSDPDRVVIHAVWGLGPSIVNGRVDPDVYGVSRDARARVTCAAGRKTSRLRMGDGGGLVEEAVPPDEQERPCLTPEEAATLARWALDLERHFGGPQDVEWALDRSRRLVVLQSRPARTTGGPAPADDAPAAGADLVLEGGATAAHGAGCGPVVVAGLSDSLEAFPEGGVLVTPQSSPRFVPVMKKAAAIVTDVGSAVGHMASLAREFGVPTIVGAGQATARLEPGAVVTVDATRRRVYRGVVPAVLDAGPPAADSRPRSRAHRLLQEVSRHIVPLSLTDPRGDAFTPLACTSLHDLARYVHERSFQEMFGIRELVGDFRPRTPILDVFLPIDLYVIDLGGGLTAPPGARKVQRSQIASPPFAALVDGMLHKGIPRFGPRSMDARGFMHVVLRQAFVNPQEDGTLRDPCYAIVSDTYVNVSARVGFHFSAVDSSCSDATLQNYVAFRFKGGAADAVRRVRRVDAIGRILRQLGFVTDVTDDLVTAQYVKQAREQTLHALEMLGRLLQFMRQMDAAMVSDAAVDQVVDDFLAGRYGLEAPVASPGP